MNEYQILTVLAAFAFFYSVVASRLERTPVNGAVVYLFVGLLCGPYVLKLVELSIDAEGLKLLAELTLALVLFLDAVKLQVEELRSRWFVPALTLGPGTTLIIALLAGTITWLTGLPVIIGFIGGAILASTDPVVLRELIRDSRIPRPTARNHVGAWRCGYATCLRG